MTFGRLLRLVPVFTVLFWCAGGGMALAQAPNFALPETTYDNGEDTTGIAVADVNKDGILDLIVAACDSGNIRVRFGVGDGTFGDFADYPTGAPGTTSVWGLAVADFNGDGYPDVATGDILNNQLLIMLNDGAGHFGTPTAYPMVASMQSIVAADFNLDHKIDLAYIDYSDNVTIMQGDGAGGFAQLGAPYPVGLYSYTIRTGDLNGDTIPDLVVPNLADDTVSILVGLGDGTFTALDPLELESGVGPVDVAMFDVDHDNITDLVVVGGPSGTVWVFTGVGDGTFIPPAVPQFAEGGPNAVEAGDFNGDGIMDVALILVDSGEVQVFTGDGVTLNPTAPFFLSEVFEPVLGAAGDFNGDGKLDLVVGDSFTDFSGVLLNDTCCFIKVTTTGTGSGVVSSNPVRITCAPDCFRGFDDGASVSLFAEPNPGFLFTGWSGAGCSGTGQCDITLASADVEVTATFDGLILGTSLPGGSVGIPYAGSVIPQNGTSPYTFALASGSLPPGTSIDFDSGAITGVPTQGGTFPFSIQAADFNDVVGVQSYSVTIAPAVTFVAANAAAATYSDSPQTVTLTGGVTALLPVSEGTATFTVRNLSSTVIGVPVTAPVVAGLVSASYVLPGGTAAQTLTITLQYSGTATFTAGTSVTPAVLAISPALSATVGANASTTYSSAPQAVPLSATVTSANGIVNGGFVTFTVTDAGNNTIGVPAVGPVTAGAATASYTLPGGTAVQTLKINASYGGFTNFQASSDLLHTLTISQAATTTAAVSTSITTNAAAQSVPLTANVTSGGGIVAGGSVVFTVRNGPTVIGAPTSPAAVAGGLATATYTLPAGTTPQTLTISAVYSGTANFLTSTGSGSLTVACAPIAVAPAIAPRLWLGRPYSLALSSPGFSDATFALTGTPPPGLNFSGGTLTGTPTAMGRFDLTATATSASSGGCTGSTAYALSVMRAPSVVTGAGGGTPHVHGFDITGATTADFLGADASVTQGVRVALGDLNGDGIDDVITAPGPGAAAPTVRVFDGATGAELRHFNAYSDMPSGGVYVAAGDVNGDGVPDIVTGRDGGTPEVRVFDGVTGARIATFTAYPAGSGGVRVAVGDVDGDGVGEIVTGPAPGGAPLVRVFTPAGTMLTSFNAYDPAFLGGVYVAAGDLDGDGHADIVTGAGAGGGPHVRAFSGVDLHELQSFFAYPGNFTGGVRVATGDINLDGHADIITGAGPGGGPHVRVWDGVTGVELTGQFSEPLPFLQGIFVAGPPPPARMAVDAPQPGGHVGSTFLIGGWAGTGGGLAGDIDVVNVWAYPVAGGTPIFVGAASTGGARPDVAAAFGGAYAFSGYTMIGNPLPSGTYDLVVFAHNVRNGGFTDRRVVRIVVQ